MVDMNKHLSQDIEDVLAKIDTGEVIECEIRWKDTGEAETVNIAMYDDDGISDDDVFYYCTSVNDFRALLKDDNGEDFVVVGFDNGKAGGRWSKTYAIGFRLYATVRLTERELLDVLGGDCSSIQTQIDNGKITLGDGDSYIPGTWLVDDDELPKSVHDAHNGDDVDINL